MKSEHMPAGMWSNYSRSRRAEKGVKRSLVPVTRLCYKRCVFPFSFVCLLKTILSLAVLLSLAGGPSVSAAETNCAAGGATEGVEVAGEPGRDALPPPPQSAREVQQGTLARFPVETLSLTGELIVRRQRGIVLHEAGFAIELAWGEDPPRASYHLRDTFGRRLESLTIRRRPDGTAELTWLDAGGAVRDTPPALTGFVQETDITWLDLTLAYLWWPDARLDGAADFRGSTCDLVRVIPPETIPGCAAVRLWVDRRLRFLRQVEQLDAADRRVRRMWVSSVGKIGDRWMIRDMEIERPGRGQRTKLHVEQLVTP